MASNIVWNTFSILILLSICFHAFQFFDKNSLHDRLYMSILYLTVFLLGVDIIISKSDGNNFGLYPVFNNIGNFVTFLLSPVIPSLWLIYVNFRVFRDETRIRRLFLPLSIVCLSNTVFLVISQFFGWYYYIDSNNVYHRGPMYALPVIITFGLIFAAFLILVLNYRSLGKKSLFSLVFFAIPPFIGIILQIAFYGISFILNSIVLSLLVVFLNIQDHTLNTDYLTGLNNRKKLDAYLKKKVKMSTGGKSFSAILVDINNFKRINDTYGHDAGDIALEYMAKLLKSCIQPDEFIARYGGDEFCIVVDISDKNELEALVNRIYQCLDEHNRSGSHPYEIELSMGYEVYDSKIHKNAAGFIKQIDILMYENKYAYKSKSNR